MLTARRLLASSLLLFIGCGGGSRPGPTPTHGNLAINYQLWPYCDEEQWTTGTSLVDPDVGSFLQAAATRWPGGIGRFARHLLDLAQVPRPPYIEALDTRVPGDDLDFTGLPLDYWAPGIPFLYARTGWDTNATSLLLQLAQVPGSGHQHQDYGSFQMWRAGHWMTRETVTYGDPVPGWKAVGQEAGSKGHAHNVILFEGIGTHAEYYDGPDNYGDGPAVVPRMGRGTDFAYAVTDLGKAYRSHASNYLEDGTTPRITDAAQVHKTFLLHSEAPLALSPLVGAPAFTSYTATSGTSLLRCTTVLPANPTAQVIDEGMAMATNTLSPDLAQYRLEVTTSGAAQSTFLHVLQARDGTGADVVPSLSEDASSYTLTLTQGGATARVVFQKGMTSSGGSFGYAATGTPTLVPLPTGVQTITVTDNGPVWGM